MPWRVELVKGWLLDEYNIDGVVLSKQDSSYLWGHCELHVPVKDAAFAEFIIKHEEKNTDATE